MDTNLKNTRFQRFVEKVDRKLLREKKIFCKYLKMNKLNAKNDSQSIIKQKYCTKPCKSGCLSAKRGQISNPYVCIELRESLGRI